MPDILHLIKIHASPERVYQALTTAEGIRSWWKSDADLDSNIGGTGEFRFNKRAGLTKVRVDELKPPARVGWTTISSNAPGGWNGTTITFDLRAEGSDTLLSFAHRGFAEANEGYALCSTGWAYYLVSLQQYLETGKGTPHPHENFAIVVAAPAESKRHAARAVTDGDTILATADVAMPPERVFRALNTKEVERWWGSADTYRMTEWAAELSPGGRWHVVVRNADGSALPAGGEFLEIEAPRKIVFTRKYEWAFPQLGQRETTVTYRLDPIATGTRVTVRHEGFAGLSQPADQHAEGWERVLGWLGAHMKAGVERDR